MPTSGYPWTATLDEDRAPLATPEAPCVFLNAFKKGSEPRKDMGGLD